MNDENEPSTREVLEYLGREQVETFGRVLAEQERQASYAAFEKAMATAQKTIAASEKAIARARATFEGAASLEKRFAEAYDRAVTEAGRRLEAEIKAQVGQQLRSIDRRSRWPGYLMAFLVGISVTLLVGLLAMGSELDRARTNLDATAHWSVRAAAAAGEPRAQKIVEEWDAREREREE